MLAIKTPAGTVLHTGDFKIDHSPIDGQVMDFGRIAELGNEGILALMSDSTNSERKGYTMSESTVGEVFEKLFQGCTKRIVVATFASNVHRVQQILSSAVKHGRKVAVCGRSMINMIETARELGITVHETGTVVVINGPRFSTKAESAFFTRQGWQVINMTAYPEAYLVKELNMCPLNISLITDYDAGLVGDVPPVSHEAVIKVFNDNVSKLKSLLFGMIENIPIEAKCCECKNSTNLDL